MQCNAIPHIVIPTIFKRRPSQLPHVHAPHRLQQHRRLVQVLEFELAQSLQALHQRLSHEGACAAHLDVSALVLAELLLHALDAPDLLHELVAQLLPVRALPRGRVVGGLLGSGGRGDDDHEADEEFLVGPSIAETGVPNLDRVEHAKVAELVFHRLGVEMIGLLESVGLDTADEERLARVQSRDETVDVFLELAPLCGGGGVAVLVVMVVVLE